MVTVYEAQLINQRIDDTHARLDRTTAEIRGDIEELKQLIIENRIQNENCKKECFKRLELLEHFKTKVLTIISGISLLSGLVIGRLMI